MISNYGNDNNMTTKITQTVLFSALLLTVIISVSQPNLVWAHHADYMIPMTSEKQMRDNILSYQEEIWI